MCIRDRLYDTFFFRTIDTSFDDYDIFENEQQEVVGRRTTVEKQTNDGKTTFTYTSIHPSAKDGENITKSNNAFTLKLLNEDTIVTISGEGILDSTFKNSSFTMHASSISDFIDVSLTVVDAPGIYNLKENKVLETIADLTGTITIDEGKYNRSNLVQSTLTISFYKKFTQHDFTLKLIPDTSNSLWTSDNFLKFPETSFDLSGRQKVDSDTINTQTEFGNDNASFTIKAKDNSRIANCEPIVFPVSTRGTYTEIITALNLSLIHI